MNIATKQVKSPDPASIQRVSCPVCGNSPGSVFLEAPDRFLGSNQLHELMRCDKCSMVWLKDAPTGDEMGQHYGGNYDQFITSAGEASPQKSQGRLEVVKRHVSGGALLDLGCSSGAFLAAAPRSDWQLFGIEMAPEVAQRARATTGAEVFVGDILDAPFPANSFDAITCFDVLEHVYDPRAVLKKVRLWLKPGGIFYTQLPNIESGEARLFKSYWYSLDLPRHILHFSPTSLRVLARVVDLEEVSFETRPNSSLEHSLYYIFENLCGSIGIRIPTLAEAKPMSVPLKAGRVALRRTAFAVLYRYSKRLGEGESIHAVFRKNPPKV